MELITKVDVSPQRFKIGYDTKITLLGSCFATEIGSIMHSLKFDILSNPFGVLYNPASITYSAERLKSCNHFDESDIISSDNRYITLHHHSQFSTTQKDELLPFINGKLENDSTHFLKSDVIIVTLGTSWVFRHIERDFIVSNCHKLPAREFNRELLDLNECYSLLERLISTRSPETRWIFTVSPIRHKKDGLHNNQLSKANLLLAIDKINHEYSNTSYFPAYEIMIDELRDYRFYADDMMHPSGLAIKIIWERFIDFCIDPDAIERMKIIEKENKRYGHYEKHNK